MDTLKARDQKGLYSGVTQEKQKEAVGIHMEAEEPRNPDLVLQNDGLRTPEEQAETVFRYFLHDE